MSWEKIARSSSGIAPTCTTYIVAAQAAAIYIERKLKSAMISERFIRIANSYLATTAIIAAIVTTGDTTTLFGMAIVDNGTATITAGGIGVIAAGEVGSAGITVATKT